MAEGTHHTAAEKAARRIDRIDREGVRYPRHDEDWWEGIRNAIQAAIDEAGAEQQARIGKLVEALQEAREWILRPDGPYYSVSDKIDAALAPFERGGNAK